MIKKVLEFLRITDEKGRFSPTNVLMLLGIVSVLAPVLSEWYREIVLPAIGGDYSQLGVLAFAVLNYLGKRIVERRPELVPQIQEREEEIEALVRNVRSKVDTGDVGFGEALEALLRTVSRR